jgi:hypothetical protein
VFSVLAFVYVAFSQTPDPIYVLLRYLHDRPYAGEDIWLSTLSRDVGLSDNDVKFVLNNQNLSDWLSIQGGYPLVTVKSKPVLLQKLIDLGVEPASLDAMQALFRGSFKTVRQFRDCKRNEHGQLQVEAVWTSKEQPSQVLWRDINSSAREYVSSQPHRAVSDVYASLAGRKDVSCGA